MTCSVWHIMELATLDELQLGTDTEVRSSAFLLLLVKSSSWSSCLPADMHAMFQAAAFPNVTVLLKSVMQISI